MSTLNKAWKLSWSDSTFNSNFQGADWTYTYKEISKEERKLSYVCKGDQKSQHTRSKTWEEYLYLVLEFVDVTWRDYTRRDVLMYVRIALWAVQLCASSLVLCL